MKVGNLGGLLRKSRYYAAATALLLSAFSLLAQSDRGTITGTVSDPAGALIPNAKIVATSTATGLQFNTESTATGNFAIPSMPAGTYDLSVEVAGFRKYTQTGIT